MNEKGCGRKAEIPRITHYDQLQYKQPYLQFSYQNSSPTQTTTIDSKPTADQGHPKEANISQQKVDKSPYLQQREVYRSAIDVEDGNSTDSSSIDTTTSSDAGSGSSCMFSSIVKKHPSSFTTWWNSFDFKEWLEYEDGHRIRWIRHYIWDPRPTPQGNCDFTHLQRFFWSIIIGISMGLYAAIWKQVIEYGVDFVWNTVPTFLLERGILFTDVNGAFPIYHYMWICPALFGGPLAYWFACRGDKFPDQNVYIKNIHKVGVQSAECWFELWCLSTLGMMSGLSLGPELPLVLTGGMFGSYIGHMFEQSILSARVMNMTAAAAAVAAFFGFPVAGSFFVLELVHRMGLEHYEALLPSIVSSITAVLVNHLLTGSDITGNFSYPYLTQTLPGWVCLFGVIYGLVGCGVGAGYGHFVLFLKKAVHNLFHVPNDEECTGSFEDYQSLSLTSGDADEMAGLLAHRSKRHRPWSFLFSTPTWLTNDEPCRMAIVGTLAAALVGVIGMYVPHTMFWGEAQLQTMIDKGRTHLPIFGHGDEPTAAMTALGFCMADPPEDSDTFYELFDLGCSALIGVSKIVVIGLSLGTGIIGGHFWGPLFVGCLAGHFFIDAINAFVGVVGFGGALVQYPTIVILSTMGAAHVVTFRDCLAISLILTLSIRGFDPDDATKPLWSAGDYAAIFPGLVIAVFVSLMNSRDFVFYKTQQERKDIEPIPEACCLPEGHIAVDDIGSDDDSDRGLDTSAISTNFSTQTGVEQASLATPERSESSRSIREQSRSSRRVLKRSCSSIPDDRACLMTQTRMHSSASAILSPATKSSSRHLRTDSLVSTITLPTSGLSVESQGSYGPDSGFL